MTRKRFKSGQLDVSGYYHKKLPEEDEKISSMARPFFKGIENEFEHIYKEAANLKKMIEMYGSKHPDELAHAEKFMFDASSSSMTEQCGG